MRDLKLRSGISKATIFVLNNIGFIDTILDLLDTLLTKREVEVESIEATITYKDGDKTKTVTIDKELESKNRLVSILIVNLIKVLDNPPVKRKRNK
jgi:hypothetical protein